MVLEVMWEVVIWVVEMLVNGIVAGSWGRSKSSGQTIHSALNSMSNLVVAVKR